MADLTSHSVPDGVDLDALQRFLPSDLEVAEGPMEGLATSHLDTFDWRLWAAGRRLRLERTAAETHLGLSGPDHRPLVVAVAAAPRWAYDLPAGHVRDDLTPLIGVRALVNQGETREQRRVVQLRDGDGDTVARLCLVNCQILDAAGQPTGDAERTVAVEELPGHEEIARTVAAALAPHLAGPATEPLVAAAAARGRRPGDYRARPAVGLVADEPAAAALGRLLLALLTTVEHNVSGVVDDVDSEFLHDLRVAVRRSRSAASELKAVVDRAAFAPHLDELRWLGQVTGPLRDLDVNLLEMDSLRAQLPAAERSSLAPLEALVAHVRDEQQRIVRAALESTRFAAFATNWRAFLTSGVIADASVAAPGPTIAKVVERRIRKAYRRIVANGRRLSDEPSAEALHRLRIDAKKLRYLLELFEDLLEATACRALVKDLKNLQNVLGGVNDTTIQQGRLTAFAHQLHASGAGGVTTFLAIGRLAAVIDHRHAAFRHGFTQAFADFASAASEHHLATLWPAPGSAP